MNQKGKIKLAYHQDTDSEPAEIGVSYGRVSTPGQEDGTSLDAQREVNQAMAVAAGVVIPVDYNIFEVGSGADPNRPGMRIVWNLVKQEEVQHVFLSRTDRWARDPLQVVMFIRHCKQHGVTIHFADGTKAETVLDEAIQYLMGFVGYQEREKTSKNTLQGKIDTAKDNRMPNGCGPGCTGYDYDPVTKTRSINAAEAAVVVKMFEWRLSGASCSEITRRLRRLGIKTKTGGEWQSGTVGNVLRNEAYTGEQWYGKNRYEKIFQDDEGNGKKRKITPRPPEEWIRIVGFSSKIIEPVVFEAVEKSFEKKPRRGIEWDYWLTPFFICGECESSVCGATLTAGQQNRKYTYAYYRCCGTLGGEGRPRICNMKGVRADKLEPVVRESIEAAVRDPEGIISGLRKEASGDTSGLDRRIADTTRKLKKQELEFDALTLQVSSGRIDQERFDRLSAPMRNAIERLKEDVGLLVRQKSEIEKWEGVEERVRVALAMYADSLGELDEGGLHRLMRLLNVKMVMTPGRVLVTGLLDPSLFTTGRTLE